jgi:glycosyltransferase 2 family protein
MSAPDGSPPERSRRRRWVGLAASLAVLVALGWALIDGWSKVSDYDWELRPAWLVAGGALLIVALWLTSIAYSHVVARLHRAPVPHAELRRVWAISILGRYVPGNVMMVAGRLELGRDLGIPRRISLAASVYEQVLLLASAALSSVAFLVIFSDLGRGARLWLIALVPLGAVALHPGVFRRLSAAVLRKAGRGPLPSVLSAREVALAFTAYAAVQMLIGLAAWLMVRSATGPPVGGPFFTALAYQLAFTVSMLAFIFPSGLGVRDGVLALALAERLPGSVAVAVSIGLRLAMTVFELVFVAAVALRRRRRDARNVCHPPTPADHERAR